MPPPCRARPAGAAGRGQMSSPQRAGQRVPYAGVRRGGVVISDVIIRRADVIIRTGDIIIRRGGVVGHVIISDVTHLVRVPHSGVEAREVVNHVVVACYRLRGAG